MPVNITQLISYPIKSCAGIQHTDATIDALGLEYDRQWMITDTQGVFISQRKYPQMALIEPHITDQHLHLNAPGMDSISCVIDRRAGTREATVWKDSLTVDQSDEHINEWLSTYLGTAAELVHYGTQSRRLINTKYAPHGQPVAFADSFPLLVTHQASLDQLNDRLSQAVGMERFRPNVVVASDHPAWQELQWRQLSTEQMHIELLKPCTRCVMTGVDQFKGEQTGSEVLKTLKQQFAHQDKAVFGINGIAQTKDQKPATLSVGQPLTVQ